MRLFFSACLAAAVLYGQPGKLQTPSAGFVFEKSSHTLRRIQGIPGAALVGAGVDFGFPITAASVSPRLDLAIVTGTDGAPHLFRMQGESPVEIPVEGLAAPVRVVFSPSGSAAALQSDGGIQVIQGLPGAAKLAPFVKLPDHGRVRRPAAETLAVSDDGAYLLYAAGGPVELIGVAGDSRKLMDAAGPTIAAFAPVNHDAAIARGGTLTVFQDVIGAATRREIAGLSTPSAVAYSPDARTVFVASERAKTVSAVDLATGDSVPLPCDCAPTTLAPMGSLFRLNEVSGAPLWLLDATAAPKLVFVPAI